MPQGTIKKLVMDKGFGFIQGERGDLFFHHSAWMACRSKSFARASRSNFEEGRGPKGRVPKT